MIAVNLNQPISLNPKKARAKQGPYPTKTAINLVSADVASGNLLTQVALFVVAVALIGIFAKFAVVDPLASGMDSSAEVSAAQKQLEELRAENANYAEVNAQYDKYVAAGLTEEEQNLADRDAVVNLLETKVMGVGYLSSLDVKGNVAVVTCLGASLDDVSKLVESLEADGRVAHVTVSTAQSDADVTASATIQITFVGALEGEDGASDGSTAGGNAVSGSDAGSASDAAKEAR